MKLMSEKPQSLQHVMQVERIHPTGVQEWLCPICFRRFVMKLTPKFNQIVLEVGDENVSHCGSTGDVHIGSARISQVEESPLPDELRIALDELLDKLDFDGD